MHFMFNENAQHGKFLHPFLSLLSFRSQLILNGGSVSVLARGLILNRPGEPVRGKTLEFI